MTNSRIESLMNDIDQLYYWGSSYCKEHRCNVNQFIKKNKADIERIIKENYKKEADESGQDY